MKHVIGGLAVLAALAADAGAQTRTVSASTSQPRLSPALALRPALPSSPALERLQFTADELPAGVRLADELRPISRGALDYYENPGVVPALDRPVARAGQTLQKGAVPVGSVLAFEFGGVVPPDVVRFVRGLVWGEGGRSREHPEVVLSYGRFLVILSFRQGEPLAAWFRTQVELRLAQLVPGKWASLEGLLSEARAARDRGDAEAGLALLQQNGVQLADNAAAQTLLGEFAAQRQDWALAETAFGRAVALQDACGDLLPDATALWSAVNGLGLVRLRGQPLGADTLALLERGVAVARGLDDPARTAQSLYVLARGLARSDRCQDSLAALAEAIRLAPERRAMAAAEADFAAARAHPEFRAALRR